MVSGWDSTTQRDTCVFMRRSVNQPTHTQKDDVVDVAANGVVTDSKIEILTDEVSGRRYSYHKTTGETEWVDKEKMQSWIVVNAICIRFKSTPGKPIVSLDNESTPCKSMHTMLNIRVS